MTKELQRLHQLTVYARWLFVMFSWITLGAAGIWDLRGDIALWLEHFTWAAVRYALAYNLISTFCLAFCIGITTAVLVWQSKNILYGISSSEKRRLHKQVKKIRDRGPSHPLWKWVFG